MSTRKDSCIHDRSQEMSCNIPSRLGTELCKSAGKPELVWKATGRPYIPNGNFTDHNTEPDTQKHLYTALQTKSLGLT